MSRITAQPFTQRQAAVRELMKVGKTTRMTRYYASGDSALALWMSLFRRFEDIQKRGP